MAGSAVRCRADDAMTAGAPQSRAMPRERTPALRNDGGMRTVMRTGSGLSRDHGRARLPRRDRHRPDSPETSSPLCGWSSVTGRQHRGSDQVPQARVSAVGQAAGRGGEVVLARGDPEPAGQPVHQAEQAAYGHRVVERLLFPPRVEHGLRVGGVIFAGARVSLAT